MRLKRLKPQQHPKAARVFWVLFPFLGFWILWKFFKYLLRNHKFYTIKSTKKRGKIIGLTAFTTLWLFKKKWFFLQYLAISKDLQGKGHGTKSLRRIEAKARHKKHDYFLLLSPPWRKKAQRFYFKNGFKRWLWFLFLKKLK